MFMIDLTKLKLESGKLGTGKTPYISESKNEEDEKEYTHESLEDGLTNKIINTIKG